MAALKLGLSAALNAPIEKSKFGIFECRNGNIVTSTCFKFWRWHVGLSGVFAIVCCGFSYAQEDDRRAASRAVYQKVQAVGLRLNRALKELCPEVADVGVIPMARTTGSTTVPTLNFIVTGGRAQQSGLRDGDVLESVNEQTVTGKSQKELVADIWRPAVEAAAKSGVPMNLTLAKTVEGGAKQVQLLPETHCGFGVGANERSTERVSASEISLRSSRISNDTPDDYIAFAFARYMAVWFMQKEGDGQFRRFAMAMLFNPTYGVQKLWFSGNDFLKADLLAMLAMKSAGYAIADFPAHSNLMASQSPKAEIVGFGNPRFEWARLSEDYKRKQSELLRLVQSSDLEGAAKLVSLSNDALVKFAALPKPTDPGPTSTPEAAQANVASAVNSTPVFSLPLAVREPTGQKNDGFVVQLPTTVVATETSQAKVTDVPQSQMAVVTGVPPAPTPVTTKPVINTEPLQHRRVIPAATGYAAIDDVDSVPLSDASKERYRDFLRKPSPKAFAIYENGRWRAHWGSAEAMPLVLDYCARESRKCWLYAVDDRVVWHEDVSKRIGSSAQLQTR